MKQGFHFVEFLLTELSDLFQLCPTLTLHISQANITHCIHHHHHHQVSFQVVIVLLIMLLTSSSADCLPWHSINQFSLFLSVSNTLNYFSCQPQPSPDNKQTNKNVAICPVLKLVIHVCKFL